MAASYLYFWPQAIEARIRRSATLTLQQQFNSKVELGTLSSAGKFAGVLVELEVNGRSDTPDFSLDEVGTPVPLHTDFSATVNGTNGDTLLHPVTALLAGSVVIAEGEVVRVPGAHGHLVSIEASVPSGRIQDFLKLAVRSEKPILSGPVKIHAKVIFRPARNAPWTNFRSMASSGLKAEIGAARECAKNSSR